MGKNNKIGFKNSSFKEQFDEWKTYLSKIIYENIPHDVVVKSGGALSPPIANAPNRMVEYFLSGHLPKMEKSIELINKHLKGGKIGISVGSWISALGLFFNMKFGMFVESISIDCDDWELPNVAKNYRKNLCFVDDLGEEKYDFISEAEMFGHYPGSDIKVLKMMAKACKTGGVMHVSVPIGNIGLDLDKDKPISISLDVDGSYEHHFRQYRIDEVVEIINKISPEFELLENDSVVTPAFGRIQITVWRKKNKTKIKKN